METNKEAIPDIELCFGCSSKSTPRLWIIDPKGAEGTAYQTFTSFFGRSLTPPSNKSYLCRPCKRLMDSYIHHILQAEKIKADIYKSCQTCTFITSGQGPLRSSKKRKLGQSYCADTNANLQITVIMTTSPNTSLGNAKSEIIKSSLAASVNQPRKKKIVKFKSIAWQEKIGQIVKLFASGAIFTGMKTCSDQFPAEFNSLITMIIKQQCSKLNKITNSKTLRANSPRNLTGIDLKALQKQIVLHSPLLWEVICAASTNKKGKVDNNRASAASLIALNARSNRLNSFQYANSILLSH